MWAFCWSTTEHIPAVDDLQFYFVSHWKNTDSTPGLNDYYCIFGIQVWQEKFFSLDPLISVHIC